MEITGKDSGRNIPESAGGKLGRAWDSFLTILLRPSIIIPVVITGLALYFGSFGTEEGKYFSLLANIIAVIAAGFSSAGIWDCLKEASGNTILKKKGGSAVRNLALSKLKVKNIADRAIHNASLGEIENLLSLLEKDISISLQEWNDILPGAERYEIAFSLLAEKEALLKMEIQEKEILKNELFDERKSQRGGEERLLDALEEKEKTILELNDQITILRNTTSSPFLTASGFPKTESLGRALTANPAESDMIPRRKCKSCGCIYLSSRSLLKDSGLCEKCNQAEGHTAP
jgi:hypothetical protein